MIFLNKEPEDNRRGNRKKGITPPALDVGPPAHPLDEDYLDNGKFPFHEAAYFPTDHPDTMGKTP